MEECTVCATSLDQKSQRMCSACESIVCRRDLVRCSRHQGKACKCNHSREGVEDCRCGLPCCCVIQCLSCGQDRCDFVRSNVAANCHYGVCNQCARKGATLESLMDDDEEDDFDADTVWVD